MASEAVASPMRLATAPGRLARPAPPGNDDPCGERRTISEGMPRPPREAFERGFRRAVPTVDAVRLWRACRPMRRLHAGHGMPIWVRRKHPSATGAPHAPREGAAKWRRKEDGERRRE